MLGPELGRSFLRTDVASVDVKPNLGKGFKCVGEHQLFEFFIRRTAPVIVMQEREPYRDTVGDIRSHVVS